MQLFQKNNQLSLQGRASYLKMQTKSTLNFIQVVSNLSESRVKINLIDTITITDKKLDVWCYTDQDQSLSIKSISHLRVADAVRAFLINLKDKDPNSQTEAIFTPDDLTQMLSDPWLRNMKICFLLDQKNQRRLLTIRELCKLEQILKGNPKALQIYSIPGRSFLQNTVVHSFKSRHGKQFHQMESFSFEQISHQATVVNLTLVNRFQDKIDTKIKEATNKIVDCLHHLGFQICDLQASYLIELNTNQEDVQTWLIDILQCLVVKCPIPVPQKPFEKSDPYVNEAKRLLNVPSQQSITTLKKITQQTPKTPISEKNQKNVPYQPFSSYASLKSDQLGEIYPAQLQFKTRDRDVIDVYQLKANIVTQHCPRNFNPTFKMKRQYSVGKLPISNVATGNFFQSPLKVRPSRNRKGSTNLPSPKTQSMYFQYQTSNDLPKKPDMSISSPYFFKAQQKTASSSRQISKNAKIDNLKILGQNYESSPQRERFQCCFKLFCDDDGVILAHGMQVENKCYVTQRDLDSVFALIIKSKNTVKENYNIKVTQPLPQRREVSGQYRRIPIDQIDQRESNLLPCCARCFSILTFILNKKH